MDVQFRRAMVAAIAASLLSSIMVAAGNQEPALKITRPESAEKQHNRTTAVLEMSRESAFNRQHPKADTAADPKRLRQSVNASKGVSSFLGNGVVPSAVAPHSLGTGGGDINEIEPNNPVAQNVSLPVNVFGRISVDGDLDFFAFKAFAGQQITVEAFAARFSGSVLVADIALFNSSGQLLRSDVGTANADPFIRFTPDSDQVLIAGITDADGFGGAFFDYLLNVTRGVDIDEIEPNGTLAQALPDVPITVFGAIDVRSDVDFYSFAGTAGQTLIVDVDAEVLGSGLDSEVNLLDPQTGIEYFYNDQSDGNDSRFNIVLPYTGKYVVGIGAFTSSSRGFYRLNLSLAPADGAPLITAVTKVSKKIIEVTGTGFTEGSSVEVNGSARTTTFLSANTLRGRVKAKSGNVVTVAIAPDDRRSNPLVVQ